MSPFRSTADSGRCCVESSRSSTPGKRHLTKPLIRSPLPVGCLWVEEFGRFQDGTPSSSESAFVARISVTFELVAQRHQDEVVEGFGDVAEPPAQFLFGGHD